MKLRVDYENVRARVQEISDIIQRLNAQKATLIQTSNNLHDAWQGEAATAFKLKFDELIQELDKAIKEMTAIKNDILTVANNIKKEDERLASYVSRAGTGGGFR